MNIGHEDDDLKPFVEPLKDSLDTNRIGKMSQERSNFYAYRIF